jgi:hypothetical protein
MLSTKLHNSCCVWASPAAAAAVFQQLEVDYCLQRPRQDVSPTRAQQVPVVRMYGVNDAGGTLCEHISRQ